MTKLLLKIIILLLLIAVPKISGTGASYAWPVDVPGNSISTATIFP